MKESPDYHVSFSLSSNWSVNSWKYQVVRLDSEFYGDFVYEFRKIVN